VEGVCGLHAYRHLIWDGLSHLCLRLDDDIFTQNDLFLPSASRPVPRPPTTTTNPVPSPDSFRLTFTDVSYNFPHPPIPTPSSFRSCASPSLSVPSSIQARVRDSARCHLTVDARRRVCAAVSTVQRSIPAEQPLSHLSSPSTTAACQRLRSMTANAPFPLSSCYQKIQWNGLPHLTHHLHRKGHSTKPIKANPIQSGTLENSLKYSPSPLPSLLHKTPHAPNQCSSSPFNLLLKTTPSHTFTTLHCPPVCWQTTKQKKPCIELPTTAYLNARPLLVRLFFRPLLFLF